MFERFINDGKHRYPAKRKLRVLPGPFKRRGREREYQREYMRAYRAAKQKVLS